LAIGGSRNVGGRGVNDKEATMTDPGEDRETLDPEEKLLRDDGRLNAHQRAELGRQVADEEADKD
jgi:hypothetical protein